MKPYDKSNVTPARELRKNMTAAERRLWFHCLRTYPVRFQRQKPIGPYIADFYCAKAGLVVELDGDYHGEKQQAQNDLERTALLERMGLSVIRFRNRDVMLSLQAVADEIDRVVLKRCAERRTTPQSLRDSSPDKGSHAVQSHTSL